MKRTPYLFSLMLFIICLLTDMLAFLFNQPLAGVLLTTSTLVVFFAAHVWFVHFPENHLRLKNIFLVIPLAVLMYVFYKTLKVHSAHMHAAGETLLSQGQLLMSRLQGGLWIIGMIFISSFVLVASLLERGAND